MPRCWWSVGGLPHPEYLASEVELPAVGLAYAAFDFAAHDVLPECLAGDAEDLDGLLGGVPFGRLYFGFCLGEHGCMGFGCNQFVLSTSHPPMIPFIEHLNVYPSFRRR